MSRGQLRKGYEAGEYSVTGALHGITGPGSRTVRALELRRLDAEAGSLKVLREFPDLKALLLERVCGLPLDPIGDLDLRELFLIEVSEADLGFLEYVQRLQVFSISESRDCTVPTRLALPRTLQTMRVFADPSKASRELVRQLVAATQWSRLDRLESLQLVAAESLEHGPLELDLRFLSELATLRRLDLSGVVHEAPEASPLEPPFTGLPGTLEWVRFESSADESDRNALRSRLLAHLGISSGVAVFERVDERRPPPQPWEISAPRGQGGPGDPWHVYGSLFDAIDDPELETESEAADVARSRIREADPALSRRIEFDGESEGTGIYAQSRADLEAALRLIGIQ